jgi:hypothetical protein
MKKLVLTAIILVTIALSFHVSAQEFPKLDASPMDMAYYPPRVAFRAFAKTDDEKNVKPQIRVVYSRPQAKGRKVFTELEKPGNMWRVGANEATEVYFYDNVKVGGTNVKAGRYTLYAKLGLEEWTIYLSNDLDRWGHYAFQPDESTVAQVTVPTMSTNDTVEAMSIIFEPTNTGADMIIAWDDTMVKVPIEF